MKPNGVVLFRDYGMHDLTQLRFAKGQRLEPDQPFYVRKDGTRSFFFTHEHLTSIVEAAGFRVISITTECRTIENRKEGKTWVMCMWLG